MISFFESLRLLACSAMAYAPMPECYAPDGVVPEPRHGEEQKLWTDAAVDAAVEVSYITIPGGEPVSDSRAPEACDNVSFLRFRHEQGPDDASQSDAAFLMVPGVLEGANGFEFIGRQMVYMAAQEYDRHVEVWAMDRRSNCLEDLNGLQAAESAGNAEEASDLILDYYYGEAAIKGRQFEGFKRSSQLPFLKEFGVRQTTLDMHAIIEHMIPDREVRKKKVFVGGHSLGGVHTSVYLGWDFDGNPDTNEDAGYKQVAGAFGLETQVVPLDTGMFFGEVERNTSGILPDGIESPMAEVSEFDDWGYRFNIMLLELGIIPRNVQIPGLFTSEVLALPEVVGLMGAKAPDEEATIYRRAPKSAAMRNIVNTIHSRRLGNIGERPTIEDFRYTNESYVGIMFDDNFQMLSFLKAGLGFMDGGPMLRKWESLDDLTELMSGAGALVGENRLFIAGDAGPGPEMLGEGPLYRWVSRDELGTPVDPEFTDASGDYLFTWLENEPVDIQDFTRALYKGPTNLTEWYFPLRILLDLPAVNKSYAPEHGLMTYHHQGPSKVPSLVINGSQGVAFGGAEGANLPLQTEIVAPGYTHMDPMFEAVNSQGKNSYVMRPLLEFAAMVQNNL
jgi:hypothetical protein